MKNKVSTKLIIKKRRSWAQAKKKKCQSRKKNNNENDIVKNATDRRPTMLPANEHKTNRDGNI